MNKAILTTVLALGFGAASGGIGYAVTNNYNQADIKNLNTQVEQVQKANDEQKVQIKDLTSRNETLSSNNESLISQNNELTSSNESLISQNSTLTLDNENLTLQNNTLIADNESLLSQTNELQLKLSNSLVAYEGKRRIYSGNQWGYSDDNGFGFSGYTTDSGDITACTSTGNVSSVFRTKCHSYDLITSNDGNKYFIFLNDDDTEFSPCYLKYGSCYFSNLIFKDYSNYTLVKYLRHGNFLAHNSDGCVFFKFEDKTYKEIVFEDFYYLKSQQLSDSKVYLLFTNDYGDQKAVIYDFDTSSTTDVEYLNIAQVYDNSEYGIYCNDSSTYLYYSKSTHEFTVISGLTENVQLANFGTQVSTDGYIVLKDISTSSIIKVNTLTGESSVIDMPTDDVSTLFGLNYSKLKSVEYFNNSLFICCFYTGNNSFLVYTYNSSSNTWNFIEKNLSGNEYYIKIQRFEVNDKIVIFYGSRCFSIINKDSEDINFIHLENYTIAAPVNVVIYGNYLLYFSKTESSSKSKTYIGLLDVNSETLSVCCNFANWETIDTKEEGIFEISNGSNVFSVFDLKDLSYTTYIIL